MSPWRRSRRPLLSEEEKDLLVRLYEGEVSDFTSEEFWTLDRFRQLRLIYPKPVYRVRSVTVQLTEKGRKIVLGIKARRWVEEYGTSGDPE